jgi:hypothetical protein
MFAKRGVDVSNLVGLAGGRPSAAAVSELPLYNENKSPAIAEARRLARLYPLN